MIEVGVNQWCFPYELSPEQGMQMAAEVGFPAIELCVEESLGRGWLTPETDRQRLKEISRHAERVGIQICSLATTLTRRHQILDPQKSERRRGIEIVRTMVRQASELGCGKVVMIAGFATPEVYYEDASATAVSTVKDLGQWAAPFGVTIGVENGGNRFLASPLEFRAFLSDVAQANVGVYLDTANAMLEGYPEHWLRTLRGRIVGIHFKDYVGPTAGCYAHLMRGKVNWRAVLAELEASEYDGVVVAEVPRFTEYVRKGIESIYTDLKFLLEQMSPGMVDKDAGHSRTSTGWLEPANAKLTGLR